MNTVPAAPTSSTSVSSAQARSSVTEDSASNSTVQDGEASNIAYETSEKIGYAATVAWLPFLLLSGSFSHGDLAAACAVLPWPFAPLADMLPTVFCLLLCGVFGLAFIPLANRFTSKQHFFRLWIAAIVCVALSLCIPSTIAEAVLLAAAFTIARLLWKAHLTNKAFDSGTLLAGTLLCGCVLLTSGLLDEDSIAFSPYILLVVSLCLFLAVSASTYKDWVFVPKEATRAKGFTATQKLFAATAKAASGIAFGTLVCTCTHQISLATSGIVWLASAGAIYALERAEKKFSKSAARGIFLMGSLVALIAIPVLPGAGRIIMAGILAFLMVENACSNAIRHIVKEKDLTLSDVYLFGFRHATNALGIIVGYMGSVAVFTFAPPPSNTAFAFFGLAAAFVTFVVLLSLGVFESKRERIPISSIVDPWHEKVMVMAKENGLTPRQTEIFDALSRGRNAKYIMQRLYLSEGTVKKQVFQIYKRLGVHTQQDLITLVMETDLDGQTPKAED